MRQKRITIFGGSGFIGRYLVKILCSDGWEVRIAVRDYEAAQFLKPLGNVGQVVIWQTDILDESQVASALDNADVAVNLVGIMYQSKRFNFNKVHKVAAQNIALVAKKLKVRKLIHVSALGVSESSKSLYSRTKAEGERCVLEAFPHAVILRPSVIFGPEDNFFNLFAKLNRYLPFLPVFGAPYFPRLSIKNNFKLSANFFGEGGPKFQPVYVGDIAEAIFIASKEGKVEGKILELGGPAIYSFKELMEIIFSVTGQKSILIPIPFKVAKVQAFFLQMFPKPLLTCDQVELLKYDNVILKGPNGFKLLGMEPRMLELIVPRYLK